MKIWNRIVSSFKELGFDRSWNKSDFKIRPLFRFLGILIGFVLLAFSTITLISSGLGAFSFRGHDVGVWWRGVFAGLFLLLGSIFGTKL